MKLNLLMYSARNEGLQWPYDRQGGRISNVLMWGFLRIPYSKNYYNRFIFHLSYLIYWNPVQISYVRKQNCPTIQTTRANLPLFVVLIWAWLRCLLLSSSSWCRWCSLSPSFSDRQWLVMTRTVVAVPRHFTMILVRIHHQSAAVSQTTTVAHCVSVLQLLPTQGNQWSCHQ